MDKKPDLILTQETQHISTQEYVQIPVKKDKNRYNHLQNFSTTLKF